MSPASSGSAGTASFMLLAFSSGLLTAKRKKEAKRRGNRVCKVPAEKAGGFLVSRRHSQNDRDGAVKREGAVAWQESEIAFGEEEKKWWWSGTKKGEFSTPKKNGGVQQSRECRNQYRRRKGKAEGGILALLCGPASVVLRKAC